MLIRGGGEGLGGREKEGGGEGGGEGERDFVRKQSPKGSPCVAGP